MLKHLKCLSNTVLKLILKFIYLSFFKSSKKQFLKCGNVHAYGSILPFGGGDVVEYFQILCGCYI